ncbi:MAG TPA: lamin tail domain-containing protein, partial [Phycisphaerae bacterium]|nr:lamin tail domain-containing protein [Phycisphaerae bacterium]
NTGAVTLGLAGLRFTEGIDFDFTTGGVLFLDPGARVLLVSDLAAFTSRYSTASMLLAGEYEGNLDNGGERLTLTDARGANVLSFSYDDSRAWPPECDGAGHSLIPLVEDTTGRRLGYGGNWRGSAVIDGSPGAADPEPAVGLRLNEVAAHTDYSDQGHPDYDSNDWIELFNAGATTVNLDGHYLSDRADALRKFALPATNLLPGAWIVFDEVSGFHSPITEGFGLDKAGEQLFLSYLPGTAADRVVDAVRFKGQENGPTLGRYSDGGDWWQATVATPGTTNALGPEHVVISQVMIDPPDGTNEYIVLYNQTDSPAELWNETGPWRLDGGVAYTFPTNTSIGAEDYLVLVPFSPTNEGARAAFMAAYGVTGEVYLLGPWDGRLDNAGERAALERPQAPDAEGDTVSWVIVDEVIYSGYEPWPTNTHATGNALQRVSLRESGNDPDNWIGLTAGLRPAKVFVTNPKSGGTLYVPFSTSASAVVDPNQVSGSVQRVDFYLNDSLLGTATTAPYAVPLDYTRVATVGLYRVRAELIDDGGTNSSVEIYFQARMAERVQLVDPADGSSRIAPFTQLVRATVDLDHVVGAVHEVTFLFGANVIYTDTTAPYEFLADMTHLPPTRWHALQAVLTDDFATTTSQTVNVYIYDSVWSNRTHRMKIRFPGYDGDSTLRDFPAPVRFSEALPGFSYSQVGSPGGADLRFADHTGTNVLFHEIENWDPAGESVVWVRLAELSGTGTWVWAYWGLEGEALPGYATNGAVWADDFALVQHMADESGGAIAESSGSGVSVSLSGLWTWGGAGAIGRSLAFNRRDGFARTGGNPLVLGAEWTLSTWFRDLQSTAWARELAILDTYNGARVVVVARGTNTLGVTLEDSFFGSGYELLPDSSIWHHLVAVGAGGDTRFVVDGQPAGIVVGSVATGTVFQLFGFQNYVPFDKRLFAGGVDELRVALTVRSADWLRADWLCQASNALFVSFEEAERQLAEFGDAEDRDGDGLRDAWELLYFGNTAADWDEDPDEDGMINLGEFVAGTDPTNAASVFRVLNVGTGWLDLSAVTGREYRVNAAPAVAGPWTNVTDWLPRTGGTMRVHFPDTPGMYRSGVRRSE